MAKNFLSYTNLDYDSIKQNIENRLGQDSRFNTFQESSFYAILSEIFTATTDFSNYYIERRAEESYLDSAKLRSSVTLLSRMLGYTIRRPTPAKTNIKITLKSLPQTKYVGMILLFPRFTKMVMGTKEFLNTITLRYSLTQDDINNFQNITGYFKEFNYYSIESGKEGFLLSDSEVTNIDLVSPIEIYQGVLKTYTIQGSSNNQTNLRFQKYTINDKTFSNFYGSEDFGYNEKTGEIVYDSNVTRVMIGSDEYTIDRKTLTPNSAIKQNNKFGDGKNINYCLIRTNIDDTVELCFGDDVTSSIGARSNTDNITITYLSTNGALANEVGVIGRSIDLQTPTLGDFLKSNVVITLNKNITSGLDIEDLEGIKLNTPGNFSSMERCVTAKDYTSFIKTLTYKSKEISNAIAWGEQEESKENSVANIKLFNIVLFTFLVNLYKKTNGLYVGIEDASLPDEDLNDYFKLVIMSDTTSPLKIDSQTLLDTDIANIYSKLENRSEISVKNLYISPLIRDFNLNGNIYLTPLSDKEKTKTKIIDALYSYLSANVDFKIPLYKSNLVDVIETFPEVKYVDLSFDSKSTYDNPFYTTSTGFDNNDVYNDVPSGAPITTEQYFTSQDIGHIFHSSIIDKSSSQEIEYSTNLDYYNYFEDFYQKCLPSIVGSNWTNYSLNLKMAICNVLPKMRLKLYKYDNTYVRYEMVWNNNLNGDNNYYATERNITMGLMRNVYDIINNFITTNTLDSKLADNLINNKCYCLLRDINIEDTTSYFANVDKLELQSFLDNDFLKIVKAFRQTFETNIADQLLDDYGNISKYTMKNEVSRIDCSSLNFLYSK